MSTTFRLPDLGEGLADAEVVRWLVAVGDDVVVDQPLVEVETAKAVVEVPSPVAGRVSDLCAAEGDLVAVGAPLVAVDEGGATSGAVADRDAELGAGDDLGDDGGAADAADGADDGPPSGGLLVGYGPRAAGPSRRRRRRTDGSATTSATTASTTTVRPGTAAAVGTRTSPRRPAAAPPTRLAARRLGIDLAALTGSGPHGRITRGDVEEAAAAEPSRVAVRAEGPRAGAAHEAPAAAPGPVPPGSEPAVAEVVPLRGAHRAQADATARSAREAPHAWAFLDVDCTASTALVDDLAGDPALDGARLGPLVLAAHAFVLALRRHPEANASYDDTGSDGPVLHRHRHVSLGVATASPRGLVVPVVARADALGLVALARAVDDVVRRARAGEAAAELLRGGTATVTNVGPLGLDLGAPLLVPGQAVILCLGAVRRRPWVVDEQVVVRDVVRLSLGFDHRVVDGALAARVLGVVGEVLGDPRRALLLRDGG